MTQLIITTAVGYGAADLWPFLKSASLHCPQASIIAIVRHDDLAALEPCCEAFPALQLHPVHTPRKPLQEAQGLRPKLRRVLARILARFRRQLRQLGLPMKPADERFHPLGLSSKRLFILNRRFFIARSLLKQSAEDIEAVLLADSRDVIFQADPFATLGSGCNTGLEYRTMAESPINASWIRSTYGDAGLERLAHELVLCSGVTIGDRESIISYLDAFCGELSNWIERSGTLLIPIWDQAYHNMMLRSVPSLDVTFQPWDSELATLGEVPREQLHVDQEGRIHVRDRIPAIVHQYDRHQLLTENVNKQYPLGTSTH